MQWLNDTNIVLISNKKNTTVVSDLRPINLCNVLMKVMTKILAKRVKGLLEKVGSDAQNTLIMGKLIFNNIMISYKFMHYLKRKKIGMNGYMALKIDMCKVYHRIKWGFLKTITRKMRLTE